MCILFACIVVISSRIRMVSPLGVYGFTRVRTLFGKWHFDLYTIAPKSACINSANSENRSPLSGSCDVRSLIPISYRPLMMHTATCSSVGQHAVITTVSQVEQTSSAIHQQLSKQVKVPSCCDITVTLLSASVIGHRSVNARCIGLSQELFHLVTSHQPR